MYSHNVLPEKAFRSTTSLVQKKMAVLGGKKTYVVGFLFCGTLKKRLAQRVRNVCTSDIDVQNLLFVYICYEFVPYRTRLERINILLFLARKVHVHLQNFLFGSVKFTNMSLF